jgi:hypothetical protein
MDRLRERAGAELKSNDQSLKILELISGVLIVLGLLLSLANWFALYQSWRTKKFYSAIPLFGACMLGGGMLLLPATRGFAWLAIPFDYGTLAVIIASPLLLKEFWSTCRFNLLHEYSGESVSVNAYLRLFRNGVFTLTLSIHLPAGQSGMSGTGNVGSWNLDGDKLRLLSHKGETAVYQVCKISNSEQLRQVTGFSRFGDELMVSSSNLILSLNPDTPELLSRQQII